MLSIPMNVRSRSNAQWRNANNDVNERIKDNASFVEKSSSRQGDWRSIRASNMAIRRATRHKGTSRQWINTVPNDGWLRHRSSRLRTRTSRLTSSRMIRISDPWAPFVDIKLGVRLFGYQRYQVSWSCRSDFNGADALYDSAIGDGCAMRVGLLSLSTTWFALVMRTRGMNRMLLVMRERNSKTGEDGVSLPHYLRVPCSVHVSG